MAIVKFTMVNLRYEGPRVFVWVHPCPSGPPICFNRGQVCAVKEKEAKYILEGVVGGGDIFTLLEEKDIPEEKPESPTPKIPNVYDQFHPEAEKKGKEKPLPFKPKEKEIGTRKGT